MSYSALFSTLINQVLPTGVFTFNNKFTICYFRRWNSINSYIIIDSM